MTCPNCDPTLYKSGKLVKVNSGLVTCSICGDKIHPSALPHIAKTYRWDSYFHKICLAVSSKSPCLSRQIGAILVHDNSIISTGYNGPPRGYHHCENICPRKEAGYKSGEGLNECSAVHAEANCIANAARIGASTIGSILYMNCILPCKDCSALLINAGIIEIVVDSTQAYHALGVSMLNETGIKFRLFNKEEKYESFDLRN